MYIKLILREKWQNILFATNKNFVCEPPNSIKNLYLYFYLLLYILFIYFDPGNFFSWIRHYKQGCLKAMIVVELQTTVEAGSQACEDENTSKNQSWFKLSSPLKQKN